MLERPNALLTGSNESPSFLLSGRGPRFARDAAVYELARHLRDRERPPVLCLPTTTGAVCLQRSGAVCPLTNLSNAPVLCARLLIDTAAEKSRQYVCIPYPPLDLSRLL
jgi:hypothetical protein